MQQASSGDPLPSDRLPFRSKLAIGVGGLSSFFGNTFLNNFALPVYQMTLGVNPALLGMAMMVPRIWDAFTDPIMGRISDNTHTRFGRRRPYIVVAAWLTGLTFGLVWMVPRHWSETSMLTYFMLTSLLYYTCFTIYSIPLTSLTYEMTPDYNERTRVMGFYTFFWKVGESINQFLFPLTQLAIFGAVLTGVRFVGWGVGLVIFGALGMLPGLFIHERYYEKASAQTRIKILPSIRDALRNRAFTVIVILTVLQAICGIFASSLDYYLLVYYMFGGNIIKGALWKGYLTLGYAVMGFVSIPLLTVFSSRFSKRAALALVYVLFALSGAVKWYVFTPGHPLKILLDPLVGAPIWIGISMIIPAMMADVCDEDERRHRHRREGMFGALYFWVQKMGFSFAFLGAGVALHLVGFDEQLGGNQPAATLLGMRVVLAGPVVLTALLALAVLAFYPISPERARETRRELEARRGAV